MYSRQLDQTSDIENNGIDGGNRTFAHSSYSELSSSLDGNKYIYEIGLVVKTVLDAYSRLGANSDLSRALSVPTVP